MDSPNGIYSLISSLDASTIFQITPSSPYNFHNRTISFVKLINFSNPHAPASTSCLYGSTHGRFIHFCLLAQEKEEISHATSDVFFSMLQIIKEPRKRKRKKQILIAELYESPIQGSSISHLLPCRLAKRGKEEPEFPVYSSNHDHHPLAIYWQPTDHGKFFMNYVQAIFTPQRRAKIHFIITPQTQYPSPSRRNKNALLFQ